MTGGEENKNGEGEWEEERRGRIRREERENRMMRGEGEWKKRGEENKEKREMMVGDGCPQNVFFLLSLSPF